MTDTENFLPFHRPVIGDDETEAVLRCLRSGWLTTGPETAAFETEFAAYLGVEHALAVNSGTAALHLALEACGIGPGDCVITTPYTFTATAEVIRYLGAHPQFVDIDESTLNIDPAGVLEILETRDDVKAILPVHIAGHPCDLGELLDMARSRDLPIIEDAAHALPAAWHGELIGTVGTATAFSFYATKTLSTGEGGMLVTADPAIAERVKVMRLHGIDRDAYRRQRADKASWNYEVVAPGFKYNMPDLAAAIGRAQLKKLDTTRQARQRIADRYSEAFADLPVQLPASLPQNSLHAWHLYVLRLDTDALTIDRDGFIARMTERGIGTSVHFIPLHLHPYWRAKYDLLPGDFPRAVRAYSRAVSLPVYPDMSDSEIERVAGAVRSILREHTR